MDISVNTVDKWVDVDDPQNQELQIYVIFCELNKY